MYLLKTRNPPVCGCTRCRMNPSAPTDEATQQANSHNILPGCGCADKEFMSVSSIWRLSVCLQNCQQKCRVNSATFSSKDITLIPSILTCWSFCSTFPPKDFQPLVVWWPFLSTHGACTNVPELRHRHVQARDVPRIPYWLWGNRLRVYCSTVRLPSCLEFINTHKIKGELEIGWNT
jgi:hypothetical protein